MRPTSFRFQLAVLLVTLSLLCVYTTTAEDGEGGDEGEGGQQAVWSDEQRAVLDAIVQHMKAQELYLGERIRSEGHSGIKQIRHNRAGTRNYYAPSHGHRNVASVHNHANNLNTAGLGEFIAVMNGVEFRTRHNDYRLVMPSTTSTGFHKTEYIPMPAVPPEVLEKNTLEEQVVELQAWFKAWADQDHSVRDYRQYFRAVLCYLEGAWVFGDVSMDGFDSDRHQIDADSYADLFQQNEFTSASGRKSNQENLAFLPTKLVELANGSIALAQWNYRIVCHPLKDELKFNRMRANDELKNRIAYGFTWHQYINSNGARFQFNHDDVDEFLDTSGTRGYLDTLMEQIPGKDNYPAYLVDDSLDMTACYLETDENDEVVPLNAGYYHRWFKVSQNSASGTATTPRGYSDENLFMALTTNEEVVPTKWKKCEGKGKDEVCYYVEQRWTYAFPLEIIYLTPLSNWNYYDIEYKGEANTDYAKTVNADGRTGAVDEELAYNGTHSKAFYITPPEFFEGGEEGRDTADTTKSVAGVLDRNGVMRELRATGIRIFLPNIPGTGVMRQRWPIMPIYGEGSAMWKELEALKDIVLHPTQYGWLGHDSDVSYEHRGLTLRLNPKNVDHSHLIYLKPEDVLRLQAGEYVWVDTEPTQGHEHRLKVFYKQWVSGQGTYRAEVIQPYESHERELEVLPEEPDDVGADEL